MAGNTRPTPVRVFPSTRAASGLTVESTFTNQVQGKLKRGECVYVEERDGGNGVKVRE